MKLGETMMSTAQNYFSNVSAAAVPCLLAWLILILSMRKDRSRYRNCHLFFIAALLTIPLIASFGGRFSGYITLGIAGILLLMVLVLPVLLIRNGIHMYKREGRSFKNLLSLFLGLVMAVVEVWTFLFIAAIILAETRDMTFPDFPGFLYGVWMLIFLSVIYISYSFIIFMLYSLFLEVVPRKRDFHYVIILGAGLLHGDQVSKLLADRLDKAIEVYRKDPTPPVLIPSGGQGGDETVSEGEAMAKYLLEHGIPAEHILPETESKNTMENLVNSKQLILDQGGEKAYTAVVTSNYHVYRALRHVRKIGMHWTGIGAHVARYYWPSALIREYVAIHTEKKHAIILLVGWLIMAVCPVWLFTGLG